MCGCVLTNLFFILKKEKSNKYFIFYYQKILKPKNERIFLFYSFNAEYGFGWVYSF